MSDKKLRDQLADESKHEEGDYDARGTFALVLVFLAVFAVYYFANWKALSDVWPVR